MKDPDEALNHHHARDKLLICDLLPLLSVLGAGVEGGRDEVVCRQGEGLGVGERGVG